jgi:hypothetical protein
MHDKFPERHQGDPVQIGLKQLVRMRPDEINALTLELNRGSDARGSVNTNLVFSDQRTWENPALVKIINQLELNVGVLRAGLKQLGIVISDQGVVDIESSFRNLNTQEGSPAYQDGVVSFPLNYAASPGLLLSKLGELAHEGTHKLISEFPRESLEFQFWEELVCWLTHAFVSGTSSFYYDISLEVLSKDYKLTEILLRDIAGDQSYLESLNRSVDYFKALAVLGRLPHQTLYALTDPDHGKSPFQRGMKRVLWGKKSSRKTDAGLYPNKAVGLRVIAELEQFLVDAILSQGVEISDDFDAQVTELSRTFDEICEYRLALRMLGP